MSCYNYITTTYNIILEDDIFSHVFLITFYYVEYNIVYTCNVF